MSLTTPRHLILTLAFVLLSGPARADLLPSPYLPLTADQISGNNAYIGGTFLCTTAGTYDAATFALDLTGSCPTTALQYADGTSVPNVMTEASLTGSVDNNGDVIGGSFAMTGVIAGLGIDDPTLLVSGTLIDAEYGPAGTGGAMLQTLIKLDFAIPEFAGLGDLLYWASFTTVSGWFGGGGVGEWEVSVDPSDFSNYSGSQYFFLDGSTILPEPGSLALFMAGLLSIAWRRRRVVPRP